MCDIFPKILEVGQEVYNGNLLSDYELTHLNIWSALIMPDDLFKIIL